ncbi:agmatine deiminase family protein [Streptomyces virginiae]|uniref:agmatine deiminase family protein n=1 Tax=Streptomyces virginiae TaxID=1961 RepID=UPI0033A379BE
MPFLPPARRTVLRALAGIGAIVAGASACGPSAAGVHPEATKGSAPAADGRRLGAEWESHTRTFMAWPALAAEVWERDLRHVREDIARIARAVGRYEAVVMMARPDEAAAAQRACGNDVEVIPLAVDDLWARDTVPVFVEEGGKVVGVDFNFNGWGKKQEHGNDGVVARALLHRYGIPRVQAPLVAEGGSFETDGEGTLLVTESSLVNDNRNRGKDRHVIEAELKRTLGVQKVVWLAGVRQATDARGRRFEVIELPQPDLNRITGEGDDFVSTYANFYIANDAVFMPQFGDRAADDRARGILQEHFPERDIVPVAIDAIASGGGGIHCSTRDQPGKPAA